MFVSIRWKLAASYGLIILLSVALTGTVALYIVQSYVGKQEGAYLRSNAEEIADLAQRFFGQSTRRLAIEELAATSAFLGDARVRILGSGREVIADSGDPGLPDDFLWLVPSELSEFQAEIGPFRGDPLPIIVPMPGRSRAAGRISPRELLPQLRDLPLGTSYVFARRVPTPWGRRFVFESMHGAPRTEQDTRAPRRKLLSITVPIDGENGQPVGWVEMSSPLSLSGQAIAPMRNAVLFSGLGALIVAALAGFLTGRTISDPLRRLASTARRMGDGDLSARASSTRGDEVGELARQLNGMAGNLESSFRDLRAERDSLKRFVADASHELRTPITALATFNELLQGSASDDPSARQEFLKESQAQLTRLQWITANLLDLSRLDAGIAGLSLGHHPVTEIVEGSVGGSLARAREKGVMLTVNADPSLSVVCDINRLQLALSNLVANAVKFVHPGGRVDVLCAAAGDRVRFVVSDNGPGIAAEEIPRVFDRFYRGRNAGGDGAGLGLAIAQSVTRAHGGTLIVRSEPGAGSTFTLEIPRDATVMPV